jgi:hypothetical protein
VTVTRPHPFWNLSFVVGREFRVPEPAVASRLSFWNLSFVVGREFQVPEPVVSA